MTERPAALLLALALLAAGARGEESPAPKARDPWAAYREGRYREALQGFLDRQVERPEDPAARLDVGSAHYQLEDYGAAERAFAAAAAADAAALRPRALYNLGNAAYRQGRLEEAVDFYRRALELASDDEDAKFNLEFVEREIERRRQQARQRQEQGEQSAGQKEEPPEQQPQSQQNQDQQNQDQQSQSQQSQSQQSQDQQNQQNQQDQQQGEDGEGEDPPQSGGEQGGGDPEQDSDGGGVPDGAEAPGPRGEEEGSPPRQGEPQPGHGEMTREEAERYLAAIQEGRPDLRHRQAKGARMTAEKDW